MSTITKKIKADTKNTSMTKTTIITINPILHIVDLEIKLENGETGIRRLVKRGHKKKYGKHERHINVSNYAYIIEGRDREERFNECMHECYVVLKLSEEELRYVKPFVDHHFDICSEYRTSGKARFIMQNVEYDDLFLTELKYVHNKEFIEIMKRIN